MPAPTRLLAVAITVAAVAVAGCDGDEAEPAEPTAAPGASTPVATVAAPTSRFCREMLELEDEAGSVDDVIEVYESLLSEVPEPIRADFEAVLDRLRLVAVGDDVAAPTVVDESALQVSSYVDLNCRGTAQSPLPPPTQPGSGDDDDDG